MAKPDENLLTNAKACAIHARDLVASARAVLSSGQNNIAYHLGVLALEEIGKRNLMMMETVTEIRELPPSWPKKHALDHEQKLFWALFGGSLFRNDVTPEDFNEAKALARSLHAKRLTGLYVDVTPDGLNIPGHAVGADEARDLIEFADSLVSAAEAEKPRDEILEEEIERRRWFLKSAEDPELQKFMFSRSSMDKLAELDDAGEWAKWLQAEIARVEAEGVAAAAREIERGKTAPDKGTKPKWRVRFRIQSASHSIRPNAFTEWNRNVEQLQLSPVSGRKREIIVELILYENVPVQNLYLHAWGLARHFVVALNIATFGFFWWRFSDDKTEWYERIDDLDDEKMEVKIEQRAHTIDWGENRVLTPEDMARAKLCFIALPNPSEDDARQYRAVDAYISALTYLAASDVHLPQETAAIGHFVRAMQLLMIEAGELKVGDPLELKFIEFIDARHKKFEEREPLLAIIRAFDASVATGKPANGPPLKPAYVSVMKMFVDWYFQEKVQPGELKRIREAAKAARDAKEP